jgi:GntR family transcriptional regulator, transcriptional repressor for pyruvate dehydrogenase complex
VTPSSAGAGRLRRRSPTSALAERPHRRLTTMPPPHRIVSVSRAEAVTRSLADYVAAAGLKVDDRLPAERDLAASLGVSRPILREALKALTALGVIESRTGSGTYLRKPLTPDDRHVIMRIEGERESLLQLLQLRRALESEAAALAARRATPEQLERLALLVAELEREFAATGDNRSSDRAFHLALYEAAGNPLFVQLIESIWPMLQRFWQYPLGKQGFADGTLPLHRVIYERIRDRDAEGARATARALLDIVEAELRS